MDNEPVKNPNAQPDARPAAASKSKADDDPRAAALRANLAKRKHQASARRGGKAVGKQEPSVFDRLNTDGN